MVDFFVLVKPQPGSVIKRLEVILMTIKKLVKVTIMLNQYMINSEEMPVCFNEMEILDWSVEFDEKGDPFLNLHADKNKR